jgi:Cof subfamily protein (haloacid dehalogenase superfamily)
MIRVVAVDLDGTLLRPDATVSPRTVAALARVARAGGRSVIVTARPPRVVEELAREAGITGLAVCSNGAIVYDVDRGSTEVTGPLSLTDARTAAQAVAALLPGAAFALETGQHAFTGPGYGHVASRDSARTATKTEDEFWSSTTVCVKLLAWTPAPVTDLMLRQVASVLPATVEVTYSGGSGMIELNSAGVSKVATLARLCADWGVSPAEVAAFGDMPNDLPVLRWAGRAVAVANAHPAVLACADEVTAGNDEDGVAMVLERLFPDGNVVPGR